MHCTSRGEEGTNCQVHNIIKKGSRTPFKNYQGISLHGKCTVEGTYATVLDKWIQAITEQEV